MESAFAAPPVGIPRILPAMIEVLLFLPPLLAAPSPALEDPTLLPAGGLFPQVQVGAPNERVSKVPS